MRVPRAQLVAAGWDRGVLGCKRHDGELASVIFGGKTVGGTLLLACIVLWFTKGIHNYFTFFGLCALWGCVLF